MLPNYSFFIKILIAFIVTTRTKWHIWILNYQRNVDINRMPKICSIGLKKYTQCLVYFISVMPGVGRSGMLDRWTSDMTEINY